MAKNTDYPFIRLWGQLMGSFSYYIQDQLERARQTNAPRTATFERTLAGGAKSGEWATVEGIQDGNTIYALKQMAQRAGIKWPTETSVSDG